MAKENQSTDYSSFEKYETAGVAARYAQQGDTTRANVALLATPVDSDGKDLLQNDPHYTTEKGIKTASEIYASKFVKGLYGLNFSDLKGFYEGSLSKLPQDTKTKVEELFDKYSEKKLEDVEVAYIDAQEILKDPNKYKRKISEYVKKDELDSTVEKALKKAKKTIEEYGDVVQARQLLQETRESPIEQKVRDNLLERIVKEE